MNTLRLRRSIAILILLVSVAVATMQHPELQRPVEPSPTAAQARSLLSTIEVKGRAPKTGYTRAQFGDGWTSINGCSTRESILRRDLKKTIVNEQCRVIQGILPDPYTGNDIQFQRGATTSDDVQIDHVVALSNAWQTGAQALSYERREAFANDPLNLLAVEGAANQQKGDGDAATWLPANKAFRCQYVQRQISVKSQYDLWVTPPEHDAILRVLATC